MIALFVLLDGMAMITALELCGIFHCRQGIRDAEQMSK